MNWRKANPARLYATSVLGALATGGLAFFAASRTWAYTSVEASGVPTAPVYVSGSDAVPLVPALALVIVAAALAVLAASARVRRVVGLLIVVVALISIVAIARAGGDIDKAVQAAIHDSPAFIGTNQPEVVSHTLWRAVTAVAFALSVFVGVAIARFGALWPTMGRKYDAPKAHAVTETVESEADIWKALDDGRDPTQ
ncbi:MAG: Trp biosynthesis-associated membrane protein [Kineosporiaceae bacterium]|nr:Trp biosynthesis-associated membrane protein [Aeromicrobium sp.]